MNFDWIVKDRVAAMARPWAADLPELRRRGITAVLSLSEDVPEEVGKAFAHLVLPVRDFQAPTPDQLAKAVRFIGEHVKTGGACAVHCGAGLGRTGTVVAAWLVAEGRTAKQAIDETRRRRPGSIETDGQEKAIADFARTARGRPGE